MNVSLLASMIAIPALAFILVPAFILLSTLALAALLIVFAHDGVTRLITIFLLLKLALPFQLLRIAIA